MERFLRARGRERCRASERLAGFVAAEVWRATASAVPFPHLLLDRVFPDETYAAMLDAMPAAAEYRRCKVSPRAEGSPFEGRTRGKIYLFPEYLRHLPSSQCAVWSVVGRALCSNEVRDAFLQRLAPGLSRRFGPDFGKVGMYPIPVLNRDIPGYRIHPHTDTHWKGITAQLCLQRDDKAAHVGTIFHERLADGSLARRLAMRFTPNRGYAFVVGDASWHSVDPVGPEVTARDSILLTYFVDLGLFRHLRNRTKRLGNFLIHELRHGMRRWAAHGAGVGCRQQGHLLILP